MDDYLITYDLKSGSPSPYKPFLTAAEVEGLLYVWEGATYVNRLTNTTVWGKFASADAANEAFKKALAAASKKVGYDIVLEKRVTTVMGSSSVISDKRKKPEAKWTGKTTLETSRLHQMNDPFFG